MSSTFSITGTLRPTFPLSSFVRFSSSVIPPPSSSASSTAPADVASASSAGIDTSAALEAGYGLDPAAIQATAAAVEVSSRSAYSPILMLENLLELVHSTSGLPWWVTIIATTVAMRSALMPLAVIQFRNSARLTIMRPEMEALTNEFNEKRARGSIAPSDYASYRSRMKALSVKHQVNPLRSMLVPLTQAPLFICFFFALRDLAERFPSVCSEGLLWIPNLGVADPLYILPVASALTMLLTIELGADTGVPSAKMGMMKNVFRGVAVLMVPATASMPAAVFLYWLPSNIISIFQVVMFKLPFVRRLLNMPIVPKVLENLPKGAPIPKILPEIPVNIPASISRTKQVKK